VVQQKKFSEMLGNVVTRYQNRSIETAQVMEELVEMAKKFRERQAWRIAGPERRRGEVL
jgi:type I restriction enzyme R subunit